MRLYLIGGFLGSGKTTAIQQACIALLAKQETVAVIANDQGEQLVDAGFIASFGITTKQVLNGCFCCNYNQLETHLNTLSKQLQPTIIFAESVGSCTDLVATIVKPLAKFHATINTVISVFTDASMLYQIIQGHASFISESIQYIYKKQLEEADVLVVNKVDLLQQDELAQLRSFVTATYQQKKILYQNSLQQADISKWLETLSTLTTDTSRTSLEIDYGIYAKGEADLAWLDEALVITTTDKTAYKIAEQIVITFYQSIERKGFAIGHLKCLIDDGASVKKMSFTTMNNTTPVSFGSSKANTVKLLINARVETTPHQLQSLLQQGIEHIVTANRCTVTSTSTAAFTPGYPTPTYRFD